MFQPSSRLLPLCLLLGALLARPVTAAVDRWSPLGPDGGTVHALAADPGAPDTLYAGTDGSGVWKSTDGGVHWASSSEGLTGLGAAEVFALAVAPGAPGTVWAGTHGGIYKTADGGATWQRVWHQAERPDDTHTPWIVSVAADPADPEVAWAGTARGWVLKTTDGGATWEQLLDLVGEADRLLIDPAHPATVYANGRAGLYKTTDGGDTWTRLREEHTDALALDPSDPRTLYSSGPPLEDLTGVWKSTDGGVTWSRLPSLDRGAHWRFVASRYPGDVNTIAFDPGRPGTIFAGGDNLLRSRDGGRTWKRLVLPGTRYEPEIAEVVISPLRPRTVFVLDFNQRRGEARSLFRSPDGGNTWKLVFEGGPAAFAPDPATPGLLYLATEFGGEIWTSTDDGVTWDRVAAGVGGVVRLTALLVDRVDPSILYLGTDGAGVLRSSDRGATWAPLDAGMIAPRITCLRADPRNPRRIVACTWGGGLLEIRVSSTP